MNITDELIETLRGIKDGKPWEYSIRGDWLPVPQTRNVLDFLRLGLRIRLAPPEPPEGYRLLQAKEKDGRWKDDTYCWIVHLNQWRKQGSFAILEDHIAVPIDPPQPDPGGWIPWHGGECPVEPETMVEARLRDGFKTQQRTAHKFRWRWEHTGESGDIIAYRVVQTAPEYVPWSLETFPTDRPVWVRHKNETGFIEEITVINVNGWHTKHRAGAWERLLEDYIQKDGSPCGTLKSC